MACVEPNAALEAFVTIEKLRAEAGTESGVQQTLETVLKIVGNVEKDPENPKYRSIKTTNKVYLSKVGLYESGNELMRLCGFSLQDGAYSIAAPALPNKGALRAIKESMSSDTIEGYSTAVSASPIPNLEMNDDDFTEADYETLLQLDNQSDVKATKSHPREVIAAWQGTVIAQEATCYVCLDAIAPGTEAMQFRCGDWYHPQCIKRWAMESKLCPICKTVLEQ